MDSRAETKLMSRAAESLLLRNAGAELEKVFRRERPRWSCCEHFWDRGSADRNRLRLRRVARSAIFGTKDLEATEALL